MTYNPDPGRDTPIDRITPPEAENPRPLPAPSPLSFIGNGEIATFVSLLQNRLDEHGITRTQRKRFLWRGWLYGGSAIFVMSLIGGHGLTPFAVLWVVFCGLGALGARFIPKLLSTPERVMEKMQRINERYHNQHGR